MIETGQRFSEFSPDAVRRCPAKPVALADCKHPKGAAADPHGIPQYRFEHRLQAPR